MTSHAARLIVYLEFERGELSIWIGICAGRLGTFGIKVGHGGPMLYNGAATCRRTCLLKVPCEGEMIIPAHPGLGLRPAPWRMCIAGFCVSGWFDMHLQGSATLFFPLVLCFLVFLNHVPEDVQVAFQAPLVFN